MAKTSRYVDPVTGSYVVENGRYKRIPAALGRAHNLVAIAGGTVTDAPHFLCRLRTVKKMRPGVATDVEHMIDEALGPHVGTAFNSYTRRAWIDSAGRLLHVLAVDGGGAEPAEIQLQR